MDYHERWSIRGGRDAMIVVIVVLVSLFGGGGGY
jgi:hypothetical protein